MGQRVAHIFQSKSRGRLLRFPQVVDARRIRPALDEACGQRVAGIENSKKSATPTGRWFCSTPGLLRRAEVRCS